MEVGRFDGVLFFFLESRFVGVKNQIINQLKNNNDMENFQTSLSHYYSFLYITTLVYAFPHNLLNNNN